MRENGCSTDRPGRAILAAFNWVINLGIRWIFAPQFAGLFDLDGDGTRINAEKEARSGMNDDAQVLYVTEEGLKKIHEELEYLKTIKREELSLKLEAAIAQGDLSENADYHAAKEEQGFVEGRIRDLEDSLRRAQVIGNNVPADVVSVGNTVTVTEEGYDEIETYHIVGPHEANPSNGRISNESPFGRALLGAKKGQTVSVETPGGQVRLTVQAIE